MNLLCTINSRSDVGGLYFKNFRVHCRFFAGECPRWNFLVLYLKISSQSETSLVVFYRLFWRRQEFNKACRRGYPGTYIPLKYTLTEHAGRMWSVTHSTSLDNCTPRTSYKTSHTLTHLHKDPITIHDTPMQPSMGNLHLIIFEAWWILNERAFYCLIIFFVWKWILIESTNQLGESSPNFIFAVVNLDPIILEKRWIDGESWPNNFVEKVNWGEDLRWVGSRCPLTRALRLRSLFVNTNWVCHIGAIFHLVTRVGLP